MKESTNKEAVLEDVDEHVFPRLCEFAYRGIYTAPTLEAHSVDADMLKKEEEDEKENSEVVVSE